MREMIKEAMSLVRDNFSWKSLIVYMFRWQLSTPILGFVMYLFSEGSNASDSLNSAIVANVIGSLIFYWWDMITFLYNSLKRQWEVKDDADCDECGAHGRVYRLVIAPRYNRMKGTNEFRCESCSISKTNELRNRGISV